MAKQLALSIVIPAFNEEKNILREDSWARSVEVPPGNHLVEFKYKPFNHLLNL